MIGIGSVSSSANALDQAQKTLTTANKRLASGLRINSAQDDAAGLAIATQMAAQLGSGNQALSNVNDGFSLTNTAGSVLSTASDTLQTMRQLAVQAANGTNSPSDREAIQAQFSQLSQSIDQMANQAEFNGQKLFSGEFTAQLQSGPQAGDTQTLTLGALSTQSLGIAGQDISSASGATAALGAIDQALTRIGAQQGAVGAAQAGLSSAAVSLAGSYENLAAAKSRLSDADYAKETATQAQAKVQQQAALQVTSKLNANQASLLQLFQKV
jgi:flagellin